MTSDTRNLTRFGRSKSKSALVLRPDHPAALAGRPMFARSANEGKRHVAKVLVSGHNSRKIGRVVTKGAWRGFPIYTLTLEERATCPRDCSMWLSCYGNRMPWSLRWPATRETESRIELELSALQRTNPYGFVVRLHVLGDFYSTDYVGLWRRWLEMFPALHVYGYTARTGDIGAAISALVRKYGQRFAIRSSGGQIAGLPAALTSGHGKAVTGAIVCPVETGRSKTCGTCALCWATNKPILFWEH